MTDKPEHGPETRGGDGRRRQVRVNVGRGRVDETAGKRREAGAGQPAGPSGQPAGPSEQPAGPQPGHSEDDSQADPAAAPTESRPEAAERPEAVAAEAEALVAEACIEELAKAEAERDAYLDQLQRLKAEFDNYRKRLQRDGEAQRLRAAEGLVESLLPVLDNMERALDAAGKHEESKLVEGVELVSGQLRSVLASQGLEEVPAEPGVPFDPNVHEAVMAQESAEYPEGTIAAVLEKGYLLHGRLLRPVRVIVAR
jgi:molecular chaperone GrpE